jgi:hypothetical protein
VTAGWQDEGAGVPRGPIKGRAGILGRRAVERGGDSWRDAWALLARWRRKGGRRVMTGGPAMLARGRRGRGTSASRGRVGRRGELGRALVCWAERGGEKRAGWGGGRGDKGKVGHGPVLSWFGFF